MNTISKKPISKKTIIAAARKWIGTPFKYYGRTKKTIYTKGGCDCIGLLIGIASELNYTINNRPIKLFDTDRYSRLKNHKKLSTNLSRYFVEKNISDLDIGDIVVFKINKYLEHIGIIGSYSSINKKTENNNTKNLTLIHAYIQAGMVVEHCLTNEWKEKIVGVYSF